MIDQPQIEEFQTNGVTLLKGIFADFVDCAREAIEQNKPELERLLAADGLQLVKQQAPRFWAPADPVVLVDLGHVLQAG